MDPVDSNSVELTAFVDVLSQVFHDEPWEAIEAYAERAWDGCGFSEEKPWDEVKDHVCVEWNDRLDRAVQQSRRLRSDLRAKMEEAKRHSALLSATLSALKTFSKRS